MFYFHDPLMNTTVPTFTPPAITRTVEPQGSPPSTTALTTTPPAGWQWASDHKGRDHKDRSATAHCAASTGSGGDEVKGKKKSASLPAWQPPKGYVRWTSQTRPTTAPSPDMECRPAADPAKQVVTWNVVSWKNIAPKTITGTRKDAVTKVESDLAAAGIQPLSVQVYPGIHTIVALQGGSR